MKWLKWSKLFSFWIAKKFDHSSKRLLCAAPKPTTCGWVPPTASDASHLKSTGTPRTYAPLMWRRRFASSTKWWNLSTFGPIGQRRFAFRRTTIWNTFQNWTSLSEWINGLGLENWVFFSENWRINWILKRSFAMILLINTFLWKKIKKKKKSDKDQKFLYQIISGIITSKCGVIYCENQ